ncbi:hypothetical protein ACFY05_41945 [Microtetraspora fusca]|uniref:Uncharacterized protein n=1 Tax=Microtetraspora fusca TaxID=1997 RepID=A0ABW6VKA5_MICFU
MAELFNTATEYLANEITIKRGTITDITAVGVYHAINPNQIPAVDQFTRVQLVDGVKKPPDPLAEAGKIDVLSLVGPRNGDVTLPPGDYQRYVLVQTATEDIIRRIDTLTIR